MTSQKMGISVAILDPLPAALSDLAGLVATVLGEHVDDSNLCAVCGSAWPCAFVVVADHNLKAVQP